MKLFILLVAISSVACEVDFDNGVYSEILKVMDSEASSGRNVACQIQVNLLGGPQPLYIIPGTDRFFHPSDRRGIMEWSANQEVELFCTNGFATPSGVVGNSIRIACSSGNVFRLNGVFYGITEFTCRNWPTSVAQRRPATQTCFKQGTLIDVGFQVESRFLRVFSACHDPRTEENYYTIYELTPSSDGSENGVTRPSWRQADFFPGKNVDTLHTRVNQRTTIATILQSQSLADRYIEPPNSNIYLARGHIAAMTDFISANEQRSTFFFINTAPQFQTFNSMNWFQIEMSTRRLAADRNIFLDVFSGTYGNGQLRDEQGINRNIFLHWPSAQIPMPRLFYKIIVNRANRAGVVFLGVNNPHLSLSEILSDYIICNDISHMINYVSWQRLDLHRGYSYACEVNDFMRRVNHIPGLIVTSLLV